MYGINLGRISSKELVLDPHLQRGVRPKVLQEVHSPGKPMPPHEDLVKETLVTAVVRDYVFSKLHEYSKCAVRGLDDHDAGVEDGHVVAGG